VLCQSECACPHKTVNVAVFFDKSNKNNYPKGRALKQMHRVVPQTKRGDLWLKDGCLSHGLYLCFTVSP